MTQSKELTDLKRLAERQGWDLEGDSGHIKWHPPDGGPFIVTSATPSDSNIIKTIRKDLENAGLILDKQQAKRLQRAIRNGDTEIKLEAIQRAAGGKNRSIADCTDEEIFASMSVNQPELWEGIKNSSVRKDVALRMFREWGIRGPDGDFPTLCATCGKTFTEPMGLAMHVMRHEPDHEPEWTWVLEEEEALEEPDGFIPCPHCDRLFMLDDLSLHVDGCADRPEAPLIVPEPDPAPEPAPESAQLDTDARSDDMAKDPAKDAASGSRDPEMSDDELYGLLEIVLDGPVLVTRESLSAINDWMDATRRLLRIRHGQTE